MGENRTMVMLRLAAVLSFLLALVNHLLPPKAFAATQLLFDYSAGFRRRGLVGSVLDAVLNQPISVTGIYAVVAVLTLVGAAAFYVFLVRFLPPRISTQLLVILVLNSFAFASFVGNTGYLDTILLSLTVGALATDAKNRVGLVARLVLCVLGVLVHENMLPYFTVLIGFDLWLARRGGAYALWIAALPVALSVVVLALLVHASGISPDQAAAFAQHLQDKAAFALDPNSTDVAGRTITQNFALMAELRHSTKYWAWVLFDGVPLLAMSVWLIWLAFKLVGDGASPLMRVLIIGTVFAPLSLNFIAFDVVRFGVASVLTGFLLIALLLRHLPDAGARLDRVLGWPLFLVVLVLNANISTIEVNIGAGHMSQFPWVLVTQLHWFAP